MEYINLIFNFTLIIFLLFLIKNNFFVLVRDSYFILFLFIFYLYIHLFPQMYIFNGHQNDALKYFFIQLQIFLFFELPLLFFYKYFIGGKYNSDIVGFEIVADTFRVNIFLIILVGLNFIFLFVAINYGLFFRRIGHDALMILSLQVPKSLFVIYRLFEETAVFLTLILHILIRFSERKRRKLIFVFVFFFITLLIYQLINSRMQLLVTIFSHTILVISFKREFNVKKLFRIGLLSIVGVLTVMIFRNIIVLEDADLKSVKSAIEDENSLDNRLNGIMLISDISSDISNRGFMYGEAWIPSFQVIYYYLFDENKANEIKENLNTTPKVNIIKFYKGNNIVDMPSSLVTDLYPNFGIIGLFFGALLIAFLLFKVVSGLIAPKGLFNFLFALYLIPLLIQEEKEYLSMLFMIFKYSSILLITFLVKPFSIVLKK